MIKSESLKLLALTKASDLENAKLMISESTEHLLNEDNQSEVAVALCLKQFENYERLLKNGKWLEPDEDFKKITSLYSTKEKRKLRDVHVNCSLDHYVMILMSKCKLVHTTTPDQHLKLFEEIFKAFKRLSKIQWIALLLKFAASFNNLQIIFDFDHDSIDLIDPTKNRNTKGIYNCKKTYVLIGAKGLLDQESEKVCRVMSSIAHEISHFVMHLLYNNDAKPYAQLDKENEQNFKKVFDKCHEKVLEEKTIIKVFLYNKSIQHAELIVCVPHILANHSLDENREKLNKLQSIFSELFEYFSAKIIGDLNRELPKIESKLKTREINDICGFVRAQEDFKVSFKSVLNFETNLQENPTIIKSNCVRLSVKCVYENFKINNMLENTVWAKCEQFDNETIFDMIVKATKACETSTLVISCEGKTKELTNELIKRILKSSSKTKLIVIVTAGSEFEAYKCEKHEHSFSQLTEESQQKLLQTLITFQGVKVELSQILNKNSSLIQLFDLDDLLDEKSIKIGTKIKFSDVNIYVERNFLKPDAKWNIGLQKFEPEPMGFKETFLSGENKNVFLLIAEPGSGKSTEFKVIARKTKENFPTAFVTYIDLKIYTKAFEKDGKVSMEFNEGKKIAEYFAGKVLKLKNLESKIFVELFTSNRVIFLFDGVDEISPSFKEFVIKMMVGIKDKSANQLWIATRPHLKAELEKSLEIKAYKFTEFSEDDRQEFFNRIFHSIDDKEDRTRVLVKVNELVAKIEKLWRRRLVFNPLLLLMVASLFEDDEEFEPSTANLFSIYNEFTKKFFKELAQKGPDAIEDFDRFMRKVNIEKYHCKKAFETLFAVNESEMKHIKSVFCDVPELPVDQIVRIGLMYDDGTGNCQFVHRTFAEFFVADFLFEAIWINFEESEAVAELWYYSMQYHSMIMKFIDDKLENFNYVEDFHASKKCTKIIIEHCQSKSEMMRWFTWNSCLNLIKFVSKTLSQEQKYVRYALTESVKAACQYQTIDFVRNLWSLIESFIENLQLEQFLTNEENWYEANMLTHAVVNEDEEVFKFFIDEGRKVASENEREIFFDPKSILSCSFVSIGRVLSRFIYKSYFEGCFKSENDLHHTLLSRACHNDVDMDTFECFIRKFRSSLSSDKIRKLCVPPGKADSFLMVAARSKSGKNFSRVWNFVVENFDESQQREFLLQENFRGLNVLHFSTLFDDVTSFIEIEKLYEEMFGIEKIKEILSKEFRFGENILHYSTDNKSAFEFLWMFMENLFGSLKLKNLLVKRCKFSDLAFDYLRDQHGKLSSIESFIFKTCTDISSPETFQFWFVAVVFSSKQFIEKLLAVIDAKQNLAEDFYSNLFEYRNSKNRSVLDYARNNWDDDVFELLLKK